jgi:hypothetical protein
MSEDLQHGEQCGTMAACVFAWWAGAAVHGIAEIRARQTQSRANRRCVVEFAADRMSSV